MKLGRLVLARVFARSLFIQAGFNADSMQALGLVYALSPALEELYPDEAARQAVVRRYLTTFNTHPYVSAAIVGGLLHHEERTVSGQEAEGRAERFKRTLQGPLAALGDAFFWRSLLPMVGAVACLSASVLGPWVALAFVAGYNVVHFTSRAGLFYLGYARGDAVVTWLQSVHIPEWSERLRGAAAVFAGAAGAWLAMRVETLPGPSSLGLVLLCVGAAAAALARWGASRYLALYLAAAGALVLGMISG